MSDGKIVISTELDSTGFQQGLNRLRSLATLELEQLGRAGKDAGNNLALGLTAGINAQTQGAVNAAAALGRSVVAGLKGYLKIKSPSRLVKEEVGKNIALGVAAGINENASEAVKAAVALAKATFDASKEFISARKYYNQMGLAEELLAWQRVQDQYVAGSKERVAAEKEAYRVKQEILAEIEAKEAAYVQGVEKRTQEILRSYGLFESIKPQDPVDGTALIQNLEDQVAALANWQESLAALTAKGVDSALVQQMADMGPKAAANLEALLTLTEEELNRFVALWQEKNALSRQQAISELTGLREQTNAEIALLLAGVEEQFANTPTMGLAMSNGLAEGILQGLSGVVQAAVTVAKAAVEAAKAELDIHSPSKVFRKIGIDANLGLAEGLLAGVNKVQMAAGLGAEMHLPTGLAPFQSVSQTKETIVQEKVIGISFSGTGAEIARLLQPQLAKEERLLGDSLIGTQL